MAIALSRLVKSFFPVPTNGRSAWWRIVQEANPGDWQKNIVTESRETLLTFAPIYACVSLIADDISKLHIDMLRRSEGVWTAVEDNGSPLLKVLRRPNTFQSSLQFLSSWMVSKLLHGNTYVLKERDARGLVRAMYVLDPRLVTPLVTESGDVFYRLCVDYLSGVTKDVPIPASEIIHDRMLCLWHPLVGIAPIIAAGSSATQGLRIQANSAKFFENMSRPSGQLTAPGEITDAAAKRLKEEFEKNFSGGNIGRLLVTGDGLKYEPMAMPPEAAQLIEQLRWTVEDVARAFKIPQYKLGLGAPTLNTIGALNQDYYTQTLQVHIESIESLLDEGLGLSTNMRTQLDLEGLLRMDPLSRAERSFKEIGSGMLAPNEARKREDLLPVEGGDTPFLQQQNFSLAALAKRDAQANPFAPASPAPAVAPPASVAASEDVEVEALLDAILTKMREAPYVET